MRWHVEREPEGSYMNEEASAEVDLPALMLLLAPHGSETNCPAELLLNF